MGKTQLFSRNPVFAYSYLTLHAIVASFYYVVFDQQCSLKILPHPARAHKANIYIL